MMSSICILDFCFICNLCILSSASVIHTNIGHMCSHLTMALLYVFKEIVKNSWSKMPFLMLTGSIKALKTMLIADHYNSHNRLTMKTISSLHYRHVVNDGRHSVSANLGHQMIQECRLLYSPSVAG